MMVCLISTALLFDGKIKQLHAVWLLIGCKETTSDIGRLRMRTALGILPMLSTRVSCCASGMVGRQGYNGAHINCVPPHFSLQRPRKFHAQLLENPIIPETRRTSNRAR
jgi:hypothetical protein